MLLLCFLAVFTIHQDCEHLLRSKNNFDKVHGKVHFVNDSLHNLTNRAVSPLTFNSPI